MRARRWRKVTGQVLDGDTVLRLPLLGLRLEPDEFFDQIAQALSDGSRRRAA